MEYSCVERCIAFCENLSPYSDSRASKTGICIFYPPYLHDNRTGDNNRTRTCTRRQVFAWIACQLYAHCVQRFHIVTPVARTNMVLSKIVFFGTLSSIRTLSKCPDLCVTGNRILQVPESRPRAKALNLMAHISPYFYAWCLREMQPSKVLLAGSSTYHLIQRSGRHNMGEMLAAAARAMEYHVRLSVHVFGRSSCPVRLRVLHPTLFPSQP